jgi:hypothetical protein
MQSKIQFGKPTAQQSKLSFGGDPSKSKQEEKKLPVEADTKKPEEKMVDEEE